MATDSIMKWPMGGKWLSPPPVVGRLLPPLLILLLPPPPLQLVGSNLQEQEGYKPHHRKSLTMLSSYTFQQWW